MPNKVFDRLCDAVEDKEARAKICNKYNGYQNRDPKDEINLRKGAHPLKSSPTKITMKNAMTVKTHKRNVTVKITPVPRARRQ